MKGDRAPGVPSELPEDWPTIEQLYVLALSACRTPDVAQDLAAEAMTRALGDPSRLTLGPLAWFRRVIGNLFRDRLRSADNARVSTMDPADLDVFVKPADSVEDEVARRELLELIMEIISGFPIELRRIVEHRFFGGMTMVAISDTLGVPRRKVERGCRRALDEIRRTLEGRKIHGVPAVAILAGAAEFRPLPSAPLADVALPVQTIAFVGTAVVASVALVWGGLGVGHAQGEGEGTAVSPTLVAQPGTPLGDAALLAKGRVVIPLAAEETAAPSSGADEARAGDGGVQPRAADPVQGTRRVEIQLIVDGKPATDWTSMLAKFDPNASLLKTGTIPVSEECPTPDAEGTFVFNIPDLTGEWLFRFREPSKRATVWLIDTAEEGAAPRVIQIDSGSITIADAGTNWGAVSTDFLVLEVNPAPNVWVLSSITLEADGSAWKAAYAAVGQARMRTVNNMRNPDHWPELNPRWSGQVQPLSLVHPGDGTHFGSDDE